MPKQKPRLPVIKYGDVVFYEITAPMRFYFPICDGNPYAAYLLDYCFSLRNISLFAYQQKIDQEEIDLAGMPLEDREVEIERRWQEDLSKGDIRQIRVYEGEDF
ncbi:hypothetical protein ccbrp13_24250 [Ktedonobacteria bacterium brp13]|nr:hypothetical protein ccbrp13_24250 [Ktedonobacteria bacterium brp13]